MFLLPPNARTLGALYLLAAWSPATTAIELDLCASFNTGTTDRNTSIYQTNGLCHDFCVEDYAFAITQLNSCWCSNFAPAKSTQEDVSDCDTPCPAYPDEDCGGDGLFGYQSLGAILPSGTEGASSSTTADSESTTQSSSTAEHTSEVRTVTVGGTVQTVTTGPTDTATTESDNAGTKVKSGGLKTGAVVGIVVGVIAAVIVGAGVLLFFWFRRRKQRQEQEGFQDDPSIRDSSSANRPDMSVVGASPVSLNGASKRNSTLQVDPRMDPFKQGLYVRGGSHESINTLGDEHDYSRRITPKVLRATNPDPA